MTGRALVREVPSSFTDALSAVAPDPPIDVALARREHARYCAALEAIGLEVTVLAADETCPDCCFVEDTAVVAAGVALITRPGAPSRRAETEAVARALARDVEVVHMDAPATLDGGDVARVGRALYVGRSSRTNAAGIARLDEVFGPRGFRIAPIDLPRAVLHLKSVCSPLDDERILLARGTIPETSFEGAVVVWASENEAYAANVVAFGAHVIVAEGHPRTLDVLRAAGFETHAVGASQVKKADGALTCQSIVF